MNLLYFADSILVYILIKILVSLHADPDQSAHCKSCLALKLIYLKFSDINKNKQIYTKTGISLKTFRLIYLFLFFKVNVF